MPDYGHDLVLGTFLTPTAANPQQAVALAQTTERAGLDLVTFQDHPYQPAFLDTWTLLSWVAASTERIHVSGNVLNLPLRPPAVLARAAASLDLLSGGRTALGLGAGAFWDAIEAMGSVRLTPGQGVDALSEAIEIIRGIWDADARTPLRVHGTHHHVDGAKRGPAPAHDIPIWLGAYKPRMLALVGRAADGWLPSLGYLKDGDLAAGNARIDEAAEAAGRDPREIVRLLNLGGGSFTGSGFLQGPPERWVDDLLPLVLQDGISTLVLGTDDAATITRFGAEVAPPCARPSPPPGPPPARRRVRSDPQPRWPAAARASTTTGFRPRSPRTPWSPGTAGTDACGRRTSTPGPPASSCGPRTPTR